MYQLVFINLLTSFSCYAHTYMYNLCVHSLYRQSPEDSDLHSTLGLLYLKVCFTFYMYVRTLYSLADINFFRQDQLKRHLNLLEMHLHMTQAISRYIHVIIITCCMYMNTIIIMCMYNYCYTWSNVALHCLK